MKIQVKRPKTKFKTREKKTSPEFLFIFLFIIVLMSRAKSVVEVNLFVSPLELIHLFFYYILEDDGRDKVFMLRTKRIELRQNESTIHNFHTYFIHISGMRRQKVVRREVRKERNSASERQTGVNFNYAVQMYGNVIHKKTITRRRRMFLLLFCFGYSKQFILIFI